MKFIKFLISNPAYLFYFAVMIAIVWAIHHDWDSFVTSPIAIKILMPLSMLAGTIGMAYHMISTYKRQ